MRHCLFVLIFVTTCCLGAGPEALLQSGLLSPEIVSLIKPELDLSEEQEKRMTEIVTAASFEAEPLDQQVREQQKAFNNILRQPTSLVEEASAALERLMEAEAAVKQLQLRTLLSLRDVLSPEQQKKAVALAPSKQAKQTHLETRVREKAARLKLAVEALGVPPTKAMTRRGEEIESLVKAGDLVSADAALDRLIKDSQINEPASTPTLDFSNYDAGDTRIEELIQRYSVVEAQAQDVVSIHLLRQLIQARQALEEAKEAEDVVTAGRILTWAQDVLKH